MSCVVIHHRVYVYIRHDVARVVASLNFYARAALKEEEEEEREKSDLTKEIFEHLRPRYVVRMNERTY
jgi:hypothetical protein